MSNTAGSVQGQEDCLYMNIFVPLRANSLPTNMPILTWIHGGSFIVGSASEPGLNGSALAVATQSIVAVPQYRLGAVSFYFLSD
jgi:carboxylesterase type B